MSDRIGELARHKAAIAVDALLMRGYDLSRQHKERTAERDSLLARLNGYGLKDNPQNQGLRTAYQKKLAIWQATRKTTGDAEPSIPPALGKAERRLLEVETQLVVLYDRIEADSTKANTERYRLESEHLMQSLWAQFRQEEREAAAKAEQERFEAWAKAKGYC